MKNAPGDAFTRGIQLCANFLFPFQCMACHAYTNNDMMLCDTCLSHVPIEHGLHCPVCDARLPVLRKCHSSPIIAIGYAASFNYALIRDLIHAYKYKSISECAHTLGNIMIRHIDAMSSICNISSWKKHALLVPIPLHPIRMRLRGFNQAALLANTIGARYHIPVYDLLTRVRNAPPHAKMKSREERIANAVDLFAIREKSVESFSQKIMILIDDVATSGATLQAAAETMQRAGAKKILALVVAKG
ncbi:MAG: ComF family protein [Patescibacteria group bacterium]|nr:ComF family protein [Patescibacteria group bacterium]MDE2438118.1 ComF family protein [Patescibacteria group bacterium]